MILQVYYLNKNASMNWFLFLATKHHISRSFLIGMAWRIETEINLSDDPKTGPPKTVVTPETVDAVCKLIMRGLHVIDCEIEGSLGIFIDLNATNF